MAARAQARGRQRASPPPGRERSRGERPQHHQRFVVTIDEGCPAGPAPPAHLPDARPRLSGPIAPPVAFCERWIHSLCPPRAGPPAGGKPAKAAVVGKDAYTVTEADGDRIRRYRVEYEFALPDGRKWAAERNIGQGEWNRLRGRVARGALRPREPRQARAAEVPQRMVTAIWDSVPRSVRRARCCASTLCAA